MDLIKTLIIRRVLYAGGGNRIGPVQTGQRLANTDGYELAIYQARYCSNELS
jgi:hypothetical protein